MTWTKTPPREPGEYWMRNSAGERFVAKREEGGWLIPGTGVLWRTEQLDRDYEFWSERIEPPGEIDPVRARLEELEGYHETRCGDCGHLAILHAEASRIVGCMFGEEEDAPYVCGCRNLPIEIVTGCEPLPKDHVLRTANPHSLEYQAARAKLIASSRPRSSTI